MPTTGTVSQAAGRTAWQKGLPVRPALLVIAIALLILIAAVQLLIWYMAVGRAGIDAYSRGIDFTATLTSARILRDGDGARLYDLATQQAAQAQVLAPSSMKPDSLLPYIHPPFEALLLAPFMWLSYGLLYALWSGLILLAIVGSLAMLARTLPVAGGVRWVLIAAACSYGALYQALWLGQSSPLVLLGLCGAYAGVKRRRDGWAGVALALMALKPQMLLVVALLLLLWRRWRVLAACGGLLAGLSVAAMPFLGVLWPLHYAGFLAKIPTWDGNYHETPAIMHNWRGLVFNLLGAAAPGLLGTLVAVLTLAALFGLVWAWWRSRGDARGDEGGTPDLVWAAGCLLAVLIAPHLYIHDLTLLIFPAWIVVARLASGVWHAPLARLWPPILWSIYLLALLFMLTAEAWPALSVVPTILLIAAAAALLIWQCGDRSARRVGTAPLNLGVVAAASDG